MSYLSIITLGFTLSTLYLFIRKWTRVELNINCKDRRVGDCTYCVKTKDEITLKRTGINFKKLYRIVRTKTSFSFYHFVYMTHV